MKAFIGQHPGQYTKTSLRDMQGGKSGPFRIGKTIVAAAIEKLLAAGELRLVRPTDIQRKTFGLRPQVKQVLEVLAHGLDYDDGNHSTTYCVATAFALGEGYDLTGRQT